MEQPKYTDNDICKINIQTINKENSNKNLNKNKHTCIDIIDNVSSIIVSVSVIYCVYYYYTVYLYDADSNIYYMKNMVNNIINGIFGQCCINLFLTYRNDSFFHHILIIGLIGCYYYFKMETVSILPQIIAILSTEISTLFLVFRYILKNTKYNLPATKFINNMFFVISFTYFRLYLVPKNFLFDVSYSQYMETTYLTTYFSFVFFYSFIYLFIGLNIYWEYMILCFLLRKSEKND